MPSTAATTIDAHPTGTGATTPAPHWVDPADYPGLPLLVGRLSIARHKGVRQDKPYLMAEFFCPSCRDYHAHRWSESPVPEYRFGMAIHRRSHCREMGRLFGRDVLLMPDPRTAPENDRVVRECNRQFARWKANRAFRDQASETRNRENAAARERTKWEKFTVVEEETLIVSRNR